MVDEVIDAPAADPAAPAADPAPNPNPPAVDPAPGADHAKVDPAADPKAAPAASEYKVPDNYKDEPWAKLVKSDEDLWKQLANAKELIGKKSVMPDLEKATPEEKEAYYASVRPAAATDYEFDDSKTTPELKASFSEMLFKNGIPKVQAKGLIEDYNALEAAQTEELFGEKGYLGEMEKSFGKEFKGTAKAADNFIRENMTEDDVKLFERLPNHSIGFAMRLANAIMKSHGIQEKDANLDTPSKIPAEDLKAKQDDLRSKILTESKKPMADHDQIETWKKELDLTYRGAK